MKRPSNLFACLLFFSILINLSIAQTFEDFKKQIREEYSSFEKETQEKFNNFVSEIDIEFSTYLSENFDDYPTERKDIDSESPKPETIIKAETVESISQTLDYQVLAAHITYQGPVSPGIKKSEGGSFDIRKVDVQFLGWPLYFELDASFFGLEFNQASPENISAFWMDMSELNYNDFLYQIGEVSTILNLNQWGYYQLIKHCGREIYPNDENKQVLFEWCMLSRSRYKAKVGYSDSQLFLMLPFVYSLYNTDLVTIGGIDYYVLNSKGISIQTYEKDFPEADVIMDVSIGKPLYTNPAKKSRDYNFCYAGEAYTVNLAYDEEVIRFYESIPLSDIRVYFNSVCSERTKNAFTNAFAPVLEGKSDMESANILLAFAQQAFDYKTDQKAYGRERYFFADEVLHYPYSDCEDRSVLFAYLVKTILKKDVIALAYPGHMATAVRMGTQEDGLHLVFKDQVYLLADPTFYGAPLGMVLSQVKEEVPDVYVLNYQLGQQQLASKAWQKVNSYGGFKADRLQDVVFDTENNLYICGYYVGEMNTGSEKLNTQGNNRNAFIIKMDADLQPLWLRGSEGAGDNMCTSMSLGTDENLYVYGSLENRLNFTGISIETNGGSDVFLAKLSADGSTQWLKKGGIDKLDQSSDFMFAATFNPKGEKIKAKLYSASETFSNYGIQMDQDGNALITGSFYATAGMRSKAYTNFNSSEQVDIPKELYEKDLQLKNEEYEATIAGLFSALNLLKSKPVPIHGGDIKTTFNTYNKRFKNYASGIYKNLGLMKFLKNERGIIAIKTNQEQDIILDKIKISHDARIRIVKYKSGNILLEVLSGIYVGEANDWLDMNSIKLFRDSGDLLFDFDYDNSVRKVNLKKEILKQ